MDEHFRCDGGTGDAYCAGRLKEDKTRESGYNGAQKLVSNINLHLGVSGTSGRSQGRAGGSLRSQGLCHRPCKDSPDLGSPTTGTP